MKKEIIDVFTWVMNSVTAQQQYSKWGDNYARKQLNDSLSEAQKELSKYVDWNNLTQKDCEEMRFCKWANEEEIKEEIDYLQKLFDDGKISSTEFEAKKQKKLNTKDLMLIPMWLYPLIPISYEVTSIFGDKIINDGKNIDNDSRRGCIAYGIIPKK